MDNQSQQKLVHRSSSMCPGEQQHIRHRKREAVQALAALGITCTAEEVPHTALLGSGGGQRAAVSLMGSLAQLSQDGLLDPMLYLAGVSGSTWTMATLCGDPQWSSSMEKHEAAMLNAEKNRDHLQTWVDKVISREDFSLSDLWALLIAVDFMKENLERNAWKLSENANRDGTNPYPIYCTTEKSCFHEDHVKGKWFELSPHEAGFPELEMFVNTSHLCSSFKGGSLEKKEPEMDMIQLQGVLSSAAASKREIYAWIKGLLGDEEPTQSEMGHYREVIDENGHAVPIWTEDLNLFVDIRAWASARLQDVLDYSKSVLRAAKHAALLATKLPSLLLKWEWGTVNNFLYECKEVPEFLSSQENIHLIDAGLMNNVGYASFLGPKRDMDLLFILEFSAGDMFQTLTEERRYAAKVKKPFPKLDDKVLIEEKDWPQGSYVFDGEGSAPTVVYMPLFNRKNCKDAKECKQKMEEFGTFQFGYSRDMMERLLDIAKGNIRSCKDVLVEELQKAVQRRRDKISQRKQ